MADVVDRLLARKDVETTEPAAVPDIEMIATQFDGGVPELLSKLWAVSDGVQLNSLNAHILSVHEAVAFVNDVPWFSERGMIPFFDMHESNWLAVCARHPLAFRVAYVSHDDDTRLLYRTFAGGVSGLLLALDGSTDADSFFRETRGDYPPDAPRMPEDQDTARALLASGNDNEEWNRAIDLLDARQLNDWARMLETDHFVRRDVRARMHQMSSPAIRALLQKDQEVFEEFANRVTQAACAAGLPVRQRKGDVLQVGRHGINLDTFFYRRNIPNAIPRIIAWIEDLLAERDPHQRPSHVMKD